MAAFSEVQRDRTNSSEASIPGVLEMEARKLPERNWSSSINI
jgi:hypothetical protein